ncbi:MAG: undecaprenyl-diphosphate phosphatase [Halanaerobiales bacterium]|nr:undecaprenyl-diphosphate phosphatase [Halanaerobiales bacterium]
MEIIKVVLLGIIQGLTEFLPVSSSGHLVLFQSLFGIESDQLTLEVFLHFGTLLPIIIIFRKDIIDIILFKKEKRQLTWLIIIGMIPTGLIGFFLKDFFAGLYSSVSLVGFMLLITGLLLYLAERLGHNRKSLAEMNGVNAGLIGIAQGIAIIPGISRSGITIVAALLQGLDRESAARYSFLLSIPVIFGAGLLETKDVLASGLEGLSWLMLAAGTTAAAISGYFAIKYLLHILKKGRLSIFSYYCWTIGLLILLLAGLF